MMRLRRRCRDGDELRGSRRLRGVGFGALLVFLTAGGVATATIVNDPPAGPAMFASEAFASDGSPAWLTAVVRDPAGDEDWAVREYRSQAGFPCLEVARLQRGATDASGFGMVGPDGSFRRLEVQDGGSPVDLGDSSEALMVNRYPQGKRSQAAIFGMVSDDVESATLSEAGASTELPIVDHVFLAVIDEDELGAASVEFKNRGGDSKTYVLHGDVPKGSTDPPSAG
jgi:hypothetical protein